MNYCVQTPLESIIAESYKRSDFKGLQFFDLCVMRDPRSSAHFRKKAKEWQLEDLFIAWKAEWNL